MLCMIYITVLIYLTEDCRENNFLDVNNHQNPLSCVNDSHIAIIQQQGNIILKNKKQRQLPVTLFHPGILSQSYTCIH